MPRVLKENDDTHAQQHLKPKSLWGKDTLKYVIVTLLFSVSLFCARPPFMLAHPSPQDTTSSNWWNTTILKLFKPLQNSPFERKRGERRTYSPHKLAQAYKCLEKFQLREAPRKRGISAKARGIIPSLYAKDLVWSWLAKQSTQPKTTEGPESLGTILDYSEASNLSPYQVKPSMSEVQPFTCENCH